MDTRLMLFAVSAFGFATMVAAEPAKSPGPSAPPVAKERPVILAAAEVPAAGVAAAAADPSAGPAAPAPRKRAARVTTCRCADTPNP